MFTVETRSRIEAELKQAETARVEGNPGRARVCARRAAGAALSETLRRVGKAVVSASAMDLLRAASELSWLSERAQTAVSRLRQRVDENYSLPQDWDLLEEARILIAELNAQG